MITTARLVLQPVTVEIARAIVDGDLSALRAGAGWPHADTVDAMTMARMPDAGPGWLITLDGVVIGDCGAYSWPDPDGVVEIGYGLAAPSRRHGYATEAVAAMCSWLFRDAGAVVITANVETENVASRRVLEKVGFVGGGETGYRLSASSSAPRS